MQRPLLFLLVLVAAAGLWFGWRFLRTEDGDTPRPVVAKAEQAPDPVEPRAATVDTVPPSRRTPDVDPTRTLLRTGTAEPADPEATWVVEGKSLRGRHAYCRGERRNAAPPHS